MPDSLSSVQFSKPLALFRLAAITSLVVVLTNLVHEAGHALMGKALGYSVFVNINSSGNIPDGYRSAGDRILTDAAGPLTTITVAIIALIYLRRRPSLVPLTIIFCALAMRLLAAVASLTGPNDEARISMAYGLGYWTLHLASVGILLALFVIAYRWQPQRWPWFAVTIPVVIATVITIVIGEHYISPLVL